MSPAYVEILEGEPAVHSNILFAMADDYGRMFEKGFSRHGE
jgi:hypothetical protein